MKNIPFLLVVAGVATISGAGVGMAQDVYVSDNTDNMITIITPSGTASTISSGLLNAPTGLAFNSQGDLFIANNGGAVGTGDIVEYDPTTEVFSTFATGLGNPRGLAFDSEGDLYVANQSTGVITEYAAGSNTPTTLASGLTFPNGIAINSAGDLFVTEGNGANKIAEITPGGTVTTLSLTGTPLNGPNGDTFGSNGDLYVADRLNPSIDKITIPGLVTSTFISNSPVNEGLNDSRSLVFGANGDLYVSDFGNNTVTEYNAAGALIDTFSSDLSGPCFVTFQPGLAVPEPGAYAMLLGGLGLLYFYQRRRTALVKI